MSVLQCNRWGCRNIMCDRYSSEHGYICDDCFHELATAPHTISIYDFMWSDKSENRHVINSRVQILEDEFPIRD